MMPCRMYELLLSQRLCNPGGVLGEGGRTCFPTPLWGHARATTPGGLGRGGVLPTPHSLHWYVLLPDTAGGRRQPAWLRPRHVEALRQEQEW